MRKIAKGRIVSIVSGPPSRPHVIIDADIIWRLPRGADSWVMTPSVIMPIAARAKLAPPVAVIDEVATRVKELAYGETRGDYLGCVIEESNSPGMTVAAISKYGSLFKDSIYPVRLVNGTGVDRASGLAMQVPVNSLSSFFHSSMEMRGPEYLVDTALDAKAPADVSLFNLTFDKYCEDGGDVMPLTQLKAALSAAEALRSDGKADGDEFGIPTPREALAAAIMLAAKMAHERPPASYTGALTRDGAHGYGIGGSLRRGVSPL